MWWNQELGDFSGVRLLGLESVRTVQVTEKRQFAFGDPSSEGR